jgi:hypothetical protein
LKQQLGTEKEHYNDFQYETKLKIPSESKPHTMHSNQPGDVQGFKVKAWDLICLRGMSFEIFGCPIDEILVSKLENRPGPCRVLFSSL